MRVTAACERCHEVIAHMDAVEFARPDVLMTFLGHCRDVHHHRDDDDTLPSGRPK